MSYQTFQDEIKITYAEHKETMKLTEKYLSKCYM
jgi:hypothetical protein